MKALRHPNLLTLTIEWHYILPIYNYIDNGFLVSSDDFTTFHTREVVMFNFEV